MSDFWNFIETLVNEHPVVLDRPKGSSHPRYPERCYPVNYGYLAGTSSLDGEGIDVWCGASGNKDITAIILTIDLKKQDMEVKLLLGCSEEEIDTIQKFHNSQNMRSLLVRRGEE